MDNLLSNKFLRILLAHSVVLLIVSTVFCQLVIPYPITKTKLIEAWKLGKFSRFYGGQALAAYIIFFVWIVCDLIDFFVVLEPTLAEDCHVIIRTYVLNKHFCRILYSIIKIIANIPHWIVMDIVARVAYFIAHVALFFYYILEGLRELFSIIKNFMVSNKCVVAFLFILVNFFKIFFFLLYCWLSMVIYMSCDIVIFNTSERGYANNHELIKFKSRKPAAWEILIFLIFFPFFLFLQFVIYFYIFLSVAQIILIKTIYFFLFFAHTIVSCNAALIFYISSGALLF